MVSLTSNGPAQSAGVRERDVIVSMDGQGISSIDDLQRALTRATAGKSVTLTVIRNGGHLVAHPHPKQGSAILSSLVGCNALVELPAEATEIQPNTAVNAILLEAV